MSSGPAPRCECPEAPLCSPGKAHLDPSDNRSWKKATPDPGTSDCHWLLKKSILSSLSGLHFSDPSSLPCSNDRWMAGKKGQDVPLSQSGTDPQDCGAMLFVQHWAPRSTDRRPAWSPPLLEKPDRPNAPHTGHLFFFLRMFWRLRVSSTRWSPAVNTHPCVLDPGRQSRTDLRPG